MKVLYAKNPRESGSDVRYANAYRRAPETLTNCQLRPLLMPRAPGIRRRRLSDSLGDFPMLAAFIRFLEELIDVANFGRDVSK